LEKEVPPDIVHLLDVAVGQQGADLPSDPDRRQDIVLSILDKVYEETYDCEFWDEEPAFEKLERLLKTRYAIFVM